MKYLYAIIFWLVSAVLSQAGAQQPDGTVGERARISAARARIETDFAQQEKVCYTRFGVNDCLLQARTKRRELLADLRKQEVSLNDTDRRRKAEEKMKEIEEKSSASKQAQDELRRVKAVEQQQERDQRAAQKDAKRQGADSPAGQVQERERKPPERRKKALRGPKPMAKTIDTAENAQAYQERIKQASDHKAKAQEKLAQQAKPAAKPLPVPP